MKVESIGETNKSLIEDIFVGYGPKTLASGWNYSAESYPWDIPATENDQAFSHYFRLGIFDLPTPSSVTRYDQETSMQMPRPSKSYRPLVNVVTYPYLFQDGRKEEMAKCGLKSPPKSYGCTDYRTTHQTSYTNYVYGNMRPPPPMSEVYKPETKFRKLLTDPFNIRRPNLGTFMDDNMDYLQEGRKPVSGPPPYGLDYQPIWTWERTSEK